MILLVGYGTSMKLYDRKALLRSDSKFYTFCFFCVFNLTRYKDAAYCYRCSMVCVCVCASVCWSPP